MATFNESEPQTDMSQTATKDMDISKETTTKDSEFNRSNIDSLGNRVRLTDSDPTTGLELFCYVQCGSEDDDTLKQCRGVVFHDKELIMRAFPYTIEVANTELEKINTTFETIFDKCTFYDAHEGTLIRMFYFNKRWFISTHRKLNAFRSKWASRESFGTAFKKALENEVSVNETLRETLPKGEEGLLENFQSTLDKTKQYMFLIRHTQENRIVCVTPDNPVVYHVGTFVDGKLVNTEDCKIPYPKSYKFKDVNELVEHVNKTDIHNLQGIICFAPENKQYKIVHKDYQELFRARGNEPSIKFRYLQVRMNRRVSDMLYHLYPEMDTVFAEIENNIYEVAKTIYNAYVQRFIKKRFVTVPTEDFNVIKECHKWHEQNRIENRINIDKVIEILNKQTPTCINRMIRRFKLGIVEKVTTNDKTQDRVRSNTVTSETNSKEVPKEVPMEVPMELPMENEAAV